MIWYLNNLLFGWSFGTQLWTGLVLLYLCWFSDWTMSKSFGRKYPWNTLVSILYYYADEYKEIDSWIVWDERKKHPVFVINKKDFYKIMQEKLHVGPRYVSMILKEHKKHWVYNDNNQRYITNIF